MRWRIRTQLLLPVLLLLVGIVAISLTTALAAADQARRQIESRLRDAARFLVEESQFPLTGDVLRQLRQLSGAEFLLVPTTGPRRTSLDTDPGEPPLPEPIASDWHTLRLSIPVSVSGQNYLCGGIRLVRGPNVGDTLFILYPESLWRDARWQAIRPSILLGTTLGLASLALALVQAHRLGKRIRELERRTRLIAAGDFSPIPLPAQNDEIRDLSSSVNEMAEQLALFQKTVEQSERLRLLGQVSGGLAHQLRNGLTGARLAVQLFLHEASDAGDISALQVAIRQLTLLETHVKRFLDLGRAGPSRREPCDLGALVDEAIALITPQCRHAQIDLVYRPTITKCALSADPGQLGQVLVNLLGNAIDAAGPGGQVEVRLERQGDRLVLEVLDTGPGPAAEIADRLFDPFVTSKPEGVGLGLAVSRQIVEGHGGQIRWERDGRTCFRVELPAE
jgi:signal transduction histidine kinase